MNIIRHKLASNNRYVFYLSLDGFTAYVVYISLNIDLLEFLLLIIITIIKE